MNNNVVELAVSRLWLTFGSVVNLFTSYLLQFNIYAS